MTKVKVTDDSWPLKQEFDNIFPEASDLVKAKKCPICTQPITAFRDWLSKKEYGISGLCQQCQDKTFGD